ncbi:hypothetical protein BGZ80_011562 [Entomortierella chlamydospora]|uniref:Uncharacterized protein n=1 Tax=Entomortierella chlamydospora TaxID=101097 RepID=A0A9P6SZ24_9FUNG|nr:hypothetical protein BGZ80_011562 [Entomortierella chlamydospora]
MCDITTDNGALASSTNHEVQVYINNRTNTFVKDGIFDIRPTLIEYRIGAQAFHDGGVLDMRGTDPGTQCTGNYDYGCYRVVGAGENILNPVQSDLVRGVNSFKFRYDKVELRAKIPRGKRIWPIKACGNFFDARVPPKKQLRKDTKWASRTWTRQVDVYL